LTTLSVIVCTYNRCEKLGRALAALDELEIPSGFDAEIVVVDNNSRDATRQVVESFASRSRLPTRYVFEAAQGLSYARNCGIREARGSLLANTDDDCIVDRQWLVEISCEFEANPEVGVVGGRVDLFDPKAQPICIRPWPDRARCNDVDEILHRIMGANLTFRREVVRKIGGFDPALGGTKGATADDVDFIYRARRVGFGVAYLPTARVRHDHGRYSDTDVARMGRSYLKGRGALYCKHVLRGDLNIARHAYWEIARAVRSKEVLTALPVLGAGAMHLLLARLRLARY
jgi:glycosyltransferase involved in cell wall biosynthesis